MGLTPLSSSMSVENEPLLSELVWAVLSGLRITTILLGLVEPRISTLAVLTTLLSLGESIIRLELVVSRVGVGRMVGDGL